MNKLFLKSLILFAVLSLCLGSCAHEKKGLKISGAAAPTKIEKTKSAISLGERMVFSVRWLGLEAGTAEVWVKEITKVKGRDAYHIQVLVRSNRFVDLLWPVRHVHHSYVDVERFHSVRYERNVREGTYHADEIMEYDQVSHKARYESRRSGDIKEMLIPKDVQDELSCTFWFRVQAMEPGKQVYIPVNLDEKNWKLEVQVQAIEELEIGGFGKIQAVRVEPFASFQGLFVHRGRMWGWMSTDERRIPLLMKARVPVLGVVSMVIKEYQLGNYHIKA